LETQNTLIKRLSQSINRDRLTELTVICVVAEKWESWFASHVASLRVVSTNHEGLKQWYENGL